MYSTNRDAGTYSISTNLTQGVFRYSTTFPPEVLSSTFTSHTTLNPEDGGGAADLDIPDLGYHYPSFHFAMGGVAVTYDINLVLTNGVSVALYNSTPIILRSGSSLTNVGMPLQLARLVPHNAVQEQPTLWGTSRISYPISADEGSKVSLRFTEVSSVGGIGRTLISSSVLAELRIRDSELYQMSIYGDGYNLGDGALSIDFRNNLFFRCYLYFDQGTVDDVTFPLSLTMKNNLFRYNAMTLVYYDTGTYFFAYNNLFDNVTLLETGYISLGNSHNAYINTSELASGGGGGNVTLTHPGDYQIGAQGPYYYPTSGSKLYTLREAGSETVSAASLYHFTVHTDHAKDTNIVAIGYHYPAIDVNGATDDDEDGVPDYRDDANGDGVWSLGEARWTSDDPDYDGVPTWREIIDGTGTHNAASANKYRLGYWRFDTTSFLTASNQTPIVPPEQMSIASSWSGNAGVYGSGSEIPKLAYNDLQTNLFPNINLRNGTVRFWFKPSWSSANAEGSGPGNNRVFMRVGTWVTGDTDLWDLRSNSDGNFFLAGAYSNSSTNYILVPFPISLVQDRWHQIAFTYSPTNMTLYTNGAVAGISEHVAFDSNGEPLNTKNYGMQIWASERRREAGIAIGNYPPTLSGNPKINGQFEEMETYNYAMSARDIARDYPNFWGSSGNVVEDTDYDGRSDMMESQVDGTSTSNAADGKQIRLAYFRFNEGNYIGEQGQIPTVTFNLSQAASWSSNSLSIGTNSSLIYRDVETNGWANFNARSGSVRFWFKPDWGGTSGPTAGSLVYLGNETDGRWELRYEASGSYLRLITGTNGSLATNFSTAFTFASNRWHQIAVTYSGSQSKIFIDATNSLTFTATGSGVSLWPNATPRTNGLIIGNKIWGGQSIRAQFEEFETFNYVLSDADISASFNSVASVDTDLNGIADVLEDIQLIGNQPFTGTHSVVTGVIEAEQFDKGGANIAYYSVSNNPASDYRVTGMFITNCVNPTDLGGGYCVDQTRSNDWLKYSLDVRSKRTFWIEPRVAGIGTNGAFRIEFWLPGATNYYTSTGPIVVTSTNWMNAGVKNVWLTNGYQTMRILMLTNGLINETNSGGVAKLNYISIYPSWNEGISEIDYVVNILDSELYTGSDWHSARSNAMTIQDRLNSTSGVNAQVNLPSGTYYVAEPTITNNLDAYAWRHSALWIPRNNIEICGQGKTNTILIAYDRATTIISLGANDPDPDNWPGYRVGRTNITIRDLGFEARPHEVATNSGGTITTYYEKGAWTNENWHGGYGAIISATGTSVANGSKYTQNVLITNCRFRNMIQAIALPIALREVLVRGNDFIAWDGPGTGFTKQENTGGADGPVSPETDIAPGTHAAILGYGGDGTAYPLHDSLVFVDNTYLCNPTLTTNIPSWDNDDKPWGTDGWLWIWSGGNYFVGRNLITNYQAEAIQFNGAPVAVVQNTFKSFIQVQTTVAFQAGRSHQSVNNLPGDDMNSFVGNSVDGGRFAINTFHAAKTSNINFCGNSLRLDNPWNIGVEPWGSAGWFTNCNLVNASGNILSAGFRGFIFQENCTNSIILKNDFSATIHGGLFWYDETISGYQVVAKNRLNQGASFHLRAPLRGNTKIFSLQNSFQPTGTNVVLEPSGAPVHFVH